jgi:AbrB family looped-hinge helix DNA binding protein
MKAIVSEKGQVTIPKELRDRLGIHSGQTLDFKAENGKLIAVKEMPVDAFEELFGILKSNKSTDELIRDMRGEADAIDNPVGRL